MIAVLLFIAAELYVIARELSRGITMMLKKRDKIEVQPATGQTINVNLASGSTSATDALPSSAPPIAADVQTIETEPQQSISTDNETVKKESTTPIRMATPSGDFAVKCPGCGAENSNYRRECFNCNIAL